MINSDLLFYDITQSAKQTVQIIAKQFGEGRAGGAITLRSIDNKQIIVGEPNQEKIFKYMAFSFEKAARASYLDADNSYTADRNPNKDQWGGAVRIWKNQNVWCSFSGWPELKDIAYIVLLLVKSNTITGARANEIFDEHGDIAEELKGIYEDMFDACRGIV